MTVLGTFVIFVPQILTFALFYIRPKSLEYKEEQESTE